MDLTLVLILVYLAIGCVYAFKRGMTFETRHESHVVNALFWLPLLIKAKLVEERK